MIPRGRNRCGSGTMPWNVAAKAGRLFSAHNDRRYLSRSPVSMDRPPGLFLTLLPSLILWRMTDGLTCCAASPNGVDDGTVRGQSTTSDVAILASPNTEGDSTKPTLGGGTRQVCAADSGSKYNSSVPPLSESWGSNDWASRPNKLFSRWLLPPAALLLYYSQESGSTFHRALQPMALQ